MPQATTIDENIHKTFVMCEFLPVLNIETNNASLSE